MRPVGVRPDHRLAGRGAELGSARSRGRRAADGQPCAVVVHGEAGVGKTRWSGRSANDPGLLVLWGSCVHFGGARSRTRRSSVSCRTGSPRPPLPNARRYWPASDELSTLLPMLGTAPSRGDRPADPVDRPGAQPDRGASSNGRGRRRSALGGRGFAGRACVPDHRLPRPAADRSRHLSRRGSWRGSSAAQLAGGHATDAVLRGDPSRAAGAGRDRGPVGAPAGAGSRTSTSSPRCRQVGRQPVSHRVTRRGSVRRTSPPFRRPYRPPPRCAARRVAQPVGAGAQLVRVLAVGGRPTPLSTLAAVASEHGVERQR